MKQKRNNDPRECPICGKPCSSGKAMGGHMRTHYTTHYLPLATMTNKKPVENSPESILNQVGENLIMNSSVESESSSQWKNPTRARSRRRRRFMAVDAEAKKAEKEQQEGFIPDPAMQHAAETLIDIKNKRIRCQEFGMLRGSKELTWEEPRVSTDLVVEEEDNIQLNEFDNEEEVRVQTPYEPLDEKLKSKVEDNDNDYEVDDNNSGVGDGISDSDGVKDEKTHQCPVCLKIFASGQGLGGHKRVHMANAGVGKGDEPSAPKLRPCLDLNLPPPETDEEVTSIEDLSTSSSDEELFG